MQNTIKVAKGALIGIGLILPGISGAMIAASLYIYEDLIVALNKVTKAPIKAVLSIWQYLTGVVFGIFLGMFFIQALFDLLLIPITFLFIGFILGGVPKMIKDAQIKDGQIKHYLVFIIMIILMLSTTLLPERTEQIQGFMLYVVVLVIGLLTSISMIIPGLSGATILLALGYYHILIDVGTAFVRAMVTVNFTDIWAQLPTALFMILGIVIGLVGIGKLVYYLIKQKPRYFYFGVLGIVLVSPFNIAMHLNQTIESNTLSFGWIQGILAVVMTGLGFYATHLLIKKTNRKIEEIKP